MTDDNNDDKTPEAIGFEPFDAYADAYADAKPMVHHRANDAQAILDRIKAKMAEQAAQEAAEGYPKGLADDAPVENPTRAQQARERATEADDEIATLYLVYRALRRADAFLCENCEHVDDPDVTAEAYNLLRQATIALERVVEVFDDAMHDET